MSILIQNVLLNGSVTDIAVEGNRICRIAPRIEGKTDTVIDGRGKAAVPPFYNTHNHAAMTLFRGLSDDQELFDWLTKHIWPAESRLTKEDIYWGTKLACMEMIRTGTVFFCDMYFEPQEILRAVDETGIRAAIGLTLMEADPEKCEEYRRKNQEMLERKAELSSRVQLVMAPHAVYTVSEKGLRDAAEQAKRENVGLTIHLAETAKEVEDCRKQHGMTPVEYLDRLGVLTDRTVAAHSIHLTDHDMAILRERKTVLSTMPCSNFKLCSGTFPFRKALQNGLRVTLGTDGCASNNNLSMFDEMKAAAMSAKAESGSPTAGSAEEVFRVATRNGAEAFGIDGGVLEEGKLADILLLDLDSPLLTPAHNLISNLVYSADSSCVDTVLCDGRILMRDRKIPGLRETLENARKCAARLAAG